MTSREASEPLPGDVNFHLQTSTSCHPNNPDGRYAAYNDEDGSMYSQSDSHSLQLVEEFGDTLRATMSTRRNNQRRWKLPSMRFLTSNRQNEQSQWGMSPVLPARFSWNRNRRRGEVKTVDEAEEEASSLAMDVPIDISKSMATLIESDVGSITEEEDANAQGMSPDHKTIKERIAKVLSNCHLVVFTENDNSETENEKKKNSNGPSTNKNSWEFHWKNLVRGLSIIVSLEVCLVVGLLIAFL